MPGSGSASRRPQRLQQLLRFDRRLQRRLNVDRGAVAGLDEAGRGPLAGPVVAGAVVLHPVSIPLTVPIDDSKRLSPSAREAAFRVILRSAEVGIGFAGEEEIDQVGIHAACHLAMLRAIRRLPHPPRMVFVDGPWVPPGCPVEAVPIVGGDAKSLSIACASIVAKVARDRLMTRLHDLFPEYGFRRHKGYGTPEHLNALRSIGPSWIHRFSFRPVRAPEGIGPHGI
ncbi:MAG: ribonuclease HII [Candidatus Omnitrophica bacterium]|nr:ribonuclease HII [Candidatus Omnitrophota bacterium]